MTHARDYDDLLATLRFYQRGAYDATVNCYANGQRSTAVILPTGCGKTRFAITLGARWNRVRKGRKLWIVHTRDLVLQAKKEIEALTDETPAVEMGDESANAASLYNTSEWTVASVQSLGRQERLSKFNLEDYALVIVDECHHDVASNIYYARIRTFFASNPDLMFVGLTATPKRADGVGLCDTYEGIAYAYPLKTAIEDAYLAGIRANTIEIESLDLSWVKTSGDDLNEKQLSEAYTDRTIQELGAAALHHCKGQTLIFMPRVKSAIDLANLINATSKDEIAITVTQETPATTRSELLKSFAECRQYRYLVGCDVFTEGYDCPPIQDILLGRPTKSLSKFMQMVGRGTRLLPGTVTNSMTRDQRIAARETSRKPYCTIHDLAGNFGRHRLLDVFDLLHDDDAIKTAARAARRNSDDDGPAVDPANLLEKAAIRDAERRERERAEKDRRAARLNVRAKTKTTHVDLFGARAQGYQPEVRRNHFARRKGPTENQCRAIRAMGGDPEGMDYADGQSFFRAKEKEKRERKLNPSQERSLRDLGWNHSVSHDRARFYIAYNRVTHDGKEPILAREYFRMRKTDNGKTTVVFHANLLPELAFNSERAARFFIQSVFDNGNSGDVKV